MSLWGTTLSLDPFNGPAVFLISNTTSVPVADGIQLAEEEAAGYFRCAQYGAGERLRPDSLCAPCLTSRILTALGHGDFVQVILPIDPAFQSGNFVSANLWCMCCDAVYQLAGRLNEMMLRVKP